jgi:hypothetical protein
MYWLIDWCTIKHFESIDLSSITPFGNWLPISNAIHGHHHPPRTQPPIILQPLNPSCSYRSRFFRSCWTTRTLWLTGTELILWSSSKILHVSEATSSDCLSSLGLLTPIVASNAGCRISFNQLAPILWMLRFGVLKSVRERLPQLEHVCFWIWRDRLPQRLQRVCDLLCLLPKELVPLAIKTVSRVHGVAIHVVVAQNNSRNECLRMRNVLILSD